LFPWGLEKRGREIKVRGEGQLVFNNLRLRLSSALDGLGLAYMPEDQVLADIKRGKLIRVLEDWCPYSPALTLLIEKLRYREV
jgi:DNA-binding transcriptional LysR family regulator